MNLGLNVLLGVLLFTFSVWIRSYLDVQTSASISKLMLAAGSISLLVSGRLEFAMLGQTRFRSLFNKALCCLILVSPILWYVYGSLGITILAFILLLSSFGVEYNIENSNNYWILFWKYIPRFFILLLFSIVNSSVTLYWLSLSVLLLFLYYQQIYKRVLPGKLSVKEFVFFYSSRSIQIVLSAFTLYLSFEVIDVKLGTHDAALYGLILALFGTPSNLFGAALRESVGTDKMNFNRRLLYVIILLALLGSFLVALLNAEIEVLFVKFLGRNWLGLSDVLLSVFLFYSLNIWTVATSYMNYRMNRFQLEWLLVSVSALPLFLVYLGYNLNAFYQSKIILVFIYLLISLFYDRLRIFRK